MFLIFGKTVEKLFDNQAIQKLVNKAFIGEAGEADSLLSKYHYLNTNI